MVSQEVVLYYEPVQSVSCAVPTSKSPECLDAVLESVIEKDRHGATVSLDEGIDVTTLDDQQE